MARCDVCGHQTDDARCPVDGSAVNVAPVEVENSVPALEKALAAPTPKKRRKS